MNSNSKNHTAFNYEWQLALLFIGLKLAGIITWSWWWVLAPLWIPVALILVLAIVALLAKAVSEGRSRRRK